MKSFLLLSVIVLLLSCSSDTDSLTGAYRMLSQFGTSQSVDTVGVNPQMKIFTGNYCMYARHGDGRTAFGVRAFVKARGGIEERNIFGMRDTVVVTSPDAYLVEIEKTDVGYKQVIPSAKFMGEDFYIEEEYKRVDTGKSSPVDGAWHLTKAFTVMDGDTTQLDVVQFKFYQSGHFIFGHSIRDSSSPVPYAGIGFGTFSMTGDDTLVENVETSNYTAIVGLSFNIKVTLNSPNELVQIVDELGGLKSVEYYERMVKGQPGGVEKW